ncbi:catalase [Nocardioides sp.]|uniref:catalase n=1 Tax=Nocardioides sp. TaxID=35761 RepID=UPI002ED69299
MEPEEAIDRLRAAFGGPPGYRTLHAKGRFYSGTFTATPEAAVLCRAGHLDGRTRPVLVRWSTASGNGRTKDTSPDIRGMAVKLAGDDGQPFDLLGQTSPSFPTQDPEEFVRIAEASVKQLTLPLFLLRHPRLVPALVRGLAGVKPHHSFAEAAFHPLHAYGWLDEHGRRTWVRYQFRPTATQADRLPETFEGRDRLAEEIAARLARGPVVHEVWVQVAGEGHDPDDVTTSWRGARELLVGRLVVTAEADDPEAGGAPTVFDPTRTVDGIKLPNDPILRYRRGAYTESVRRRTS